MKLKTATVTYRWSDQLRPYCNHESIVQLDFGVLTEDLDHGLAELERRLDAASAIAEAAVTRAIERTRPEGWTPPANGNGNGHSNGNGNGHAPQSPPPSGPPATASANGNEPPAGRDFGPPTNSATFAGWVNNEGSQYRDAAMAICKKQRYGTYFKKLSDEQAMWVYGQLCPKAGAA